MKKTISVLLTILMLLSLMPMATFAEELNAPKLIIDSADATPGDTVSVNISLKNNPGFVTAGITLAFDEGLTLVGATNGSTFPASMQLTMPKQLTTVGEITGSCNFAWSGTDISDSDIRDGVILSLRFNVSADAEIGDAYNITVSARKSDFVDKNLQTVEMQTVQSKITVIDYKPGDVNDDGVISLLDTVMINRYVVDGCKYDPDGYAIRLNEQAADVNDDGSISLLDTVMISRYIVDKCKTDPEGYNIELKPSTKRCQHEMEATEAKAATCTKDGNHAYWYCSICGKYFSDVNGSRVIMHEDTIIPAKGHTVVIDPAVPATETSTGLTEGSHCSECELILVPQVVIPIPEPNTANITYRLVNNDSYLAEQTINNPNPSFYVIGKGLSLSNDIEVPGYTFVGWYDSFAENATQIKTISANETNNITIYAHWRVEPYDITYKLYQTPLGPISDSKYLTYTVNKGLVDLPNPELNNYIFMGWYTDEGQEVENIPRGMTGDITLNAHWTSKRNLARKINQLGDPIIGEDSDEGVIYFAYELGTIENVPLAEIWTIQSVAGLAEQKSETVEKSISATRADEISNTIIKETVDTGTWTLSESWNDNTSVTEEFAKSLGMEVEEANEYVKTSANTFSITNEVGGSKSKTKTDGTTAIEYNSENSKDSHGGERHENYGFDLNVSAKIGLGGEKNSGKNSGKNGNAFSLSVGPSLDFTGDIGIKETVNNETDKHTGTDTTTIDTTVTNNTRSWNNSQTSSKTEEISQREYVSEKLSEAITNKYNYGKSYSNGGENSSAKQISTTDNNAVSSSSSLTYFDSETKITTTTYTTDGMNEGSYRLVLAGKFHVFGVVGYDVASSSYFTYTYSVLDDKTYEFLDYSPDQNFNDYENGALPFEIPHDISEYVSQSVLQTKGLGFETNTTSTTKTAKVTSYTGTDTDIIIPSYFSTGGKCYKVTEIDSEAFAGKNIRSVVLSRFIDGLPNGAFKNCTNLEEILGFYTKIGAEAFSGCTKLNGYRVSSATSFIGENAFKGINSVYIEVLDESAAVIAAGRNKPRLDEETDGEYAKRIKPYADALTQSIVNQALKSGANNITLDISDVIDGVALAIEAPEMNVFRLVGGERDMTEFTIKSYAATTQLEEVFVSNTSGIPLTISSENLILDAVSFNSPSFCLALLADETKIILKRDNRFESEKENCIVSKNINLEKIKNEDNVLGSMHVNGNVCVCGEVSPQKSISFTKGEVVQISEKLYQKYIKGEIVLRFDANGGKTPVESQVVYSGFKVGQLPTPTRDYYHFEGWYTDPEEGKAVDEMYIPSSDSDLTLFAHWSQNDISDWVLAEEVPEDAQTVNEKWTYDLTTNITSDKDSKEGYTLYDSTWEWGPYGSWSAWQDAYVASSDSREVQTQSVPASYKTVYHYYRYATSWGGVNSYCYQESGTSYFEYTSDSELSYYDNYGGGTYKYYYNGVNFFPVLKCDNFARQEVASYKTQYHYRDRAKIYTYYLTKTDYSLESPVEVTESDSISNVQKWVQYREK